MEKSESFEDLVLLAKSVSAEAKNQKRGHSKFAFQRAV
jgi:hypothetical protein